MFHRRRSLPHCKVVSWATARSGGVATHGPQPLGNGGATGAPAPSLSPMDTALARPLAQLVAWGRVGIGVSCRGGPDPHGPAVDRARRQQFRAAGSWPAPWADGTWPSGSGPSGLSDSPTPRPGPGWPSGGMADAVDALATVLAFGSLPRRSRWGILALTVGAAVVSTRAAAALDSPSVDGRSVQPVRTAGRRADRRRPEPAWPGPASLRGRRSAHSGWARAWACR